MERPDIIYGTNIGGVANLNVLENTYDNTSSIPFYNATINPNNMHTIATFSMNLAGPLTVGNFDQSGLKDIIITGQNGNVTGYCLNPATPTENVFSSSRWLSSTINWTAGLDNRSPRLVRGMF